MALQAGTLFVPRPEASLVIREGQVAPASGGQSDASPLLRSLADEVGEDALVIVADSDSGIRPGDLHTIRAAGGDVIFLLEDRPWNDPHVSISPTPLSADVILEQDELAERLALLLQTTEPSLAAPLCERVLEVLDLAESSRPSPQREIVSRWVHRRGRLNGSPTPLRYLDLLEHSGVERRALRQRLSLAPPDLHRDRPAQKALEELALRPLVRSAGPGGQLRVWVPAVSSGDEAFVVAMLLQKVIDEAEQEVDYRVFVTSDDPDTLARLEKGLFDMAVERWLPPDLAETYLEIGDDGPRLTAAVRQHVVSSGQQLLADPPFTRLQLICCRSLRNWDEASRERALSTLVYALEAGGYLLLGEAIDPDGVSESLESVTAQPVLHRRTASAVAPPPLAPSRRPGPAAEEAAGRSSLLPHGAVARLLAQRGAIFALLLDEAGSLAHVYGEAGANLHVPEGEMTTDVEELTRGELRSALLSALEHVRRFRGPTHRPAVPVWDGDSEVRADLSLHEVREGRESAHFHLAVFSRSSSPDPAPSEETALHRRVRELESWLEEARGELKEVGHTARQSAQQLQSEREELLATHSELRLVSEELRRSREELQEERSRRGTTQRELERIDHHAPVGLILLDEELCLRRFSRHARQVVHLLGRDVGRPIAHLSHTLREVDLSELCQRVLRTGEPLSEKVGDETGRVHLLRAHRCPEDPEQSAEGVVLTIAEVTDLDHERAWLGQRFATQSRALEQLRTVALARDVEGLRLLYVSSYCEELWGVSRIEVLEEEEPWLRGVHPEDRHAVRAFFQASHEEPESIEYRMIDDSGEERWLRATLRPPESDDDHAERQIGFVSDITDARRTETALSRAVDQMHAFVDALPDDIYWITGEGCWRSFREEVSLDTPSRGSCLEEAKSCFLHGLPEDARERLLEACETARRTGELQTVAYNHDRREEVRSYEIRLLPVPGEGMAGVVRDTSDLRQSERELVSLTRRLERQANHDHLTDLTNRRGLEKELFLELERCRRYGTRLSAVLIDCDNFKRINDSLGHATGDVVLLEIGRRLRAVVRPSDSIGRVGGDEFLVLLPGTRQAEAMQLAERLRLAVSDSPLETADQVIGITASLGVANVPHDVVSIEEVISFTQHALSQSKSAGKNRVTIKGSRHERSATEQENERATEILRSGEGFRTLAQVVCDMRDERILGYELLTRGPAGLLENAEDLFRLSSEKNILTTVDLHCVKRNVRWARENGHDQHFHLNLFPSTILDTPADRLLSVFGDPKLLSNFCVEISEQQFIGDPAYLRPHVEELRREGARIALDDVGFGRSSLEALILLEPDIVKIDKSVVTGAHEDPAQQRVLHRLVEVAHGLDMEVIAEGVETEADRDVLLGLGVHQGQGWLYGRPGPALN